MTYLGIDIGTSGVKALLIDRDGRALGEAHEGAALVVVGFIAAHLLALVWHERRDGVPVAQAMISGYQYRSESEVTGEHVAR